MKVYVHCDVEPSFTKVLRVQPDRHVTLADLVTDFLTAYRDKHGASVNPSLTPSSVQVRIGERKPAALTAAISKVVRDQDDIFVEPASHVTTASATSAQHTPGPPPAVSAGQVAATSSTATTETASSTDTETDKDSEREQAARLLHQYLQRAQAAAEQSNFKHAGHIYSQLLDLLPTQADLLLPAASMWLRQAHLPARAEPLARRLVAAAPVASTSHELLGDCLMGLDEPQEAVTCYDRAIDAARAAGEGPAREADLQVLEAEALLACTDNPAYSALAAKLTMDVLSVHESHRGALRLYALIAEEQGMHADALRVALRVLVTSSKDARIRALLARRLQAEGGLQTLYQELSIPTTTQPTTPHTTTPPANSQQTDATVPVTYSNGDSGPVNNAAALAFLATCVKDVSALRPTIELLEKAVSLHPGHFGYHLNLGHAWELEQRLDKVIDVAARGMRLAIQQGVTLGGGTDLQACAELLTDLPPWDPPVTSLAWYNRQTQHTNHQRETLATDTTAPTTAPTTPPTASATLPTKTSSTDTSTQASHASNPISHTSNDDTNTQSSRYVTTHTAASGNTAAQHGDSLHGETSQEDGAGSSMQQGLGMKQSETELVGATVSQMSELSVGEKSETGASGVSEKESERGPVPKVQYSTAQLDLLALCFTAVKALYVGGALDTAARLVKRLLPARDASEQALHLTLIRNEAAYFGCVVQLTDKSSQTGPIPQAPTSPIHITSNGHLTAASDSTQGTGPHTSTTQETASCQQQQRPLYLAGDSHTLSAAWRYVTLRKQRRLIQPVLVTGCKIWHLRPESCFYPKAQFTASVGALPPGSQVISDLVLGRGLEVFVHPVPPVLNETRAVVVPFNAALKAKVTSAASSAKLRGKLHWLDFAHDLLTPDGTALAQGLRFDGTHLSPAYVRFLDREMAAVE